MAVSSNVLPCLVVLAFVPVPLLGTPDMPNSTTCVLCQYDYNAAGLVLSSLAAVLLLAAVVIMIMIAAMWHSWYTKRQFRRGKPRIPRAELQERGLFAKRNQNARYSPRLVRDYKPHSLIGEEILPALSPQPMRPDTAQYVIAEATNPTITPISPPSPRRQVVNGDQYATAYVATDSTRDQPTEIKSRQTQPKVVRYAPIHIHAATVDNVTPTSAVYGQSTSGRSGGFEHVYVEDITPDPNAAVVNFDDEDNEIKTANETGRSTQANVLY